MTIYVDDLRTWNKKKWAHLCATDLVELDIFATITLGLKREHCQKGAYTYYCLNRNLRDKALRRGAKYLSTEELLKKVKPEPSPLADYPDAR